MPMQSICCQALKRGEMLKTTFGERPRPILIDKTRKSPALITADHVAVIVGEPTDAPGDISAVAAIL